LSEIFTLILRKHDFALQFKMYCHLLQPACFSIALLDLYDTAVA